MTTATAVLKTVPAASRLPRTQARQGNGQLAILGDFSDNILVSLLAQGVRWADDSCRIGGTLSMALRNTTPWQAAQLIAAMQNDGVELMGQVPGWLNRNGLRVLSELA